jgi:phosphotriesterase-related protein
LKIQTVNGAIDIANLGKTLMHEHLVIGFPGWEGDTLIERATRREMVAACIDRIEELKSHGYSSLVDPCPNDLGRDIDVMGEVAALTGFNVIFATGLYEEKFAGAYWKEKLHSDPDAAAYLTELYIQELSDGVGRTGPRASVIKVATGAAPFPKYEQIAMQAAAAASKETGAPIITHTDAVDGDKQLAFLVSHGAQANRVIVGHSCGCTDHEYHRRICEGGSYIGFDRFGIERLLSDEDRIQSLVRMIEAGFTRQVIISHDCAFHVNGQIGTKERAKAAVSRRPVHFERNIAPRLRAMGVSQGILDTLLTANPRSYFEGREIVLPSMAEATATA